MADTIDLLPALFAQIHDVLPDEVHLLERQWIPVWKILVINDLENATSLPGDVGYLVCAFAP